MTQQNYIDAAGLHTEDLATITADIQTQMRSFYGADINLDSNSPDGQLIGIFAQCKLDMLDTTTQVYNSMSPERATGVVLDQRVAYNGIIRRAESFTVVPMTIVTNQIVTLNGADTSVNPFMASDPSGNKFQLLVTTTLPDMTGASAWGSGTTYAADAIVSASGVYYKSLQSANTNHAPASSPTWWVSLSLSFQSVNGGAILTTLNSITTAVSPTLGVVSVNNPVANTQEGVDEETDVQLRQRRQASVANASTGFLDGLTGALKAIDGVTDAIVYENTTGTTDSDGIPGHSIWCIVDGGTSADIADVIYRKRNAGCGMKGSVTVDIVQVNGTAFPLKFDRANAVPLYIQLGIKSIDPNHVPDGVFLEEGLAEVLSYKIHESADWTVITSLIKTLDPLAVVVSGGVSLTNGSYSQNPLPPATVQDRFEVDATYITISVS